MSSPTLPLNSFGINLSVSIQSLVLSPDLVPLSRITLVFSTGDKPNAEFFSAALEPSTIPPNNI